MTRTEYRSMALLGERLADGALMATVLLGGFAVGAALQLL